MIPRRTILFSALLLLIAVTLSVYALRPKEAEFQGKPVSVWFKEYVALRDDLATSPPEQEELEALERYREVFRELGSNSVSYLQEVLQSKGTVMVRLYRLFFKFVPALQKIFPKPSSELEMKLQAAELLVMLGKDPTTSLAGAALSLSKGDDSTFIYTLLQILNSQNLPAIPDKK
jgi:hypothetical protein